MQVKICGLSHPEEVNFCVKYRADFCGFILNYPKSHRFISFEQAKLLTNLKKKDTKFVGVLVNATEKELKIYSQLNFDYFQLYGNYESEDLIKIKRTMNKKIIIALQIKNQRDVDNYKKFINIADIILWDSTGLEKSVGWDFDWIRNIPDGVTKMIAGNINFENLEKVSKIADIVDVSGALETNKVKDISKIKKFLDKVRYYQ